ncbi:hypothetical protein PINS_up009567 [Pythium insidiosum]|nr:hypothetical protein PINS_up009567 [Pythium insidiosum]
MAINECELTNWCFQELNQYLDHLLAMPEVKASKILREFLEDSNLSDESDDEDALPTKVLEGLPGTIVSVRAGQTFSVSLDMHHAGDIASWQFSTKKHNIGFSASFNGETVRVYSREEAHAKPVKGSFRCDEPGTLTLDWDNTYTWSKTKVLIYWAEVEQASQLLSADTVRATPITGDGIPALDNRRAGFIVQSRTAGMLPRQLVNSSISLITKPFVWGKTNHTDTKTGSLIVEREVKFRGRNWYRKWFVLDTNKFTLRYYDSEAAARKGLSLSTIKLTWKNATLAITSHDDGAPTPYLFMVRSKKRCWKVCAASAAEKNEWEHAISTAILAAQLKRRRKSKRLKSADDENIEDLGGGDANPENGESDQDEDDEEGKDDDDEDGKDDDDDSEESESDHEHVLSADKASSVDASDCITVSQSLVSISSHGSSIHSSSAWCASEIKKGLLVLWINGVILMVHSSSFAAVALTVVAMNVFIGVSIFDARSAIVKK